ncbi:MAG: anaerobic ribonucleoside-triphosphate reductase activating protein [Bacteroidota bacterium]|nr:anaerobic ribonucleoside-triphosphate reductase activating protein [Bacteroidota bacterium]
MKIAGFKKQSLIDYPGNISSVVFTQGCNFRCGFCHNPNLVLPEKFEAVYDEEEIFDYLTKYSKLLNAVCITGGEPTMHKDLPLFITKIKELGLKIKLDSNGTNPDMLQYLFKNNLIDSIAMDIKHILEFKEYNNAVGNFITKETFLKVLNSIDLIKSSKIDYEFRTTVAKGLHNKKHIRILQKQFGVNYQIHNFNPEIVLDPNLNIKPFSESEYKELVDFQTSTSLT